MSEQTTKSEADGNHPSSNYLVVEDPKHPGTWHLRVRDKEGKVDRHLLGAAHAALTVGYRGNKYEGPQKEEALAKLKSLYKEEGMAWPSEASATAAASGQLEADAKDGDPGQPRRDDGRYHSAATATREAYAASGGAKTREDHRKASGLHKKAMELHEANNDPAMARMHREKMVEHNDCANALTASAPASADSPQCRMFESSLMTEAPQAASAWKGFMVMAGGVRTMTVGCRNSAGQKLPVTVTVNVNPAGARALQATLECIRQNSKQKAFNCFDHGGSAGHTEASSWPTEFWWDNQKRAIFEAAEPSDSGAGAIAGKRYRGFSLTFFTNADITETADGKLAIEAGAAGSPENPAEFVRPPDVAEHPERYLNMGTLTNKPASVDNDPLFASDPGPNNSPAADAAARTAGAHSSPTKTQMKTENKQLDAAALQAEQTQLEQRIQRLEADKTDSSAAQLEAARAELRTLQTQAELANAQKKIADFETEKQRQLEAAADTAVEDMINSQQIARFDKELQAQWRRDFVSNPALINRVVQRPGGRTAGSATALEAARHGNSGSVEFGFSVPTEMKQLLALVNANARVRIVPGMSRSQLEACYEEKGKLALQAGLLFKKALAPKLDEWRDIPPSDLAKCVGLNPMEAMQSDPMKLRRALEAGDYTDPNNQFQTLNGTLVLQRTLPLYAYDYPELLAMYTDFSDAPGLFEQTEMSRVVNIPAVLLYNAGLDANGRPIGFVVASPASTVDAPLTLSAYIAVPIVIGQATLSATQRRLFDETAAAGIKAIASYFVGMVAALLTPANYNGYAAVTAPDANGVVKIPTAYATYAMGIQDFSLTDLDKLSAILTQNQVPRTGRGVLLNAQYFAKLRSDPRLAYYFATAKADPMLTEQELPESLSGFAPYEAPWLPPANNLAFFPFHKAAIMLKSRLPMDYTQAVNAMVPGSITTVTDPDTRMSIALVQRVDLVGNYAEWRPEVQLGANVGDKRGGMCGTAQ